jgi:F420-0:gamma-glutamyl ligase-like protein
MNTPKRIWWARAGKLCALERPGGGGRSHRPQRRAAEIEYLKESGVRLVVSLMATRHNLRDYEEAGLEVRHVPLASWDEAREALADLVALLRRELRRRGAVAVHANRHTDLPAAVCAAYMRDAHGADPDAALRAAAEAGLAVTPEAYEAVQLRSAIAAATSSGRSVTT